MLPGEVRKRPLARESYRWAGSDWEETRKGTLPLFGMRQGRESTLSRSAEVSLPSALRVTVRRLIWLWHTWGTTKEKKEEGGRWENEVALTHSLTQEV